MVNEPQGPGHTSAICAAGIALAQEMPSRHPGPRQITRGGYGTPQRSPQAQQNCRWE